MLFITFLSVMTVQAQTLELPSKLESSFRFMGGLMFVEAQVNGQTGWFMMDTGSNSSFVLNSVYFKGNETGQEVKGMSGSQRILNVQVDSLVWGGLRLDHIILPAMNFSSMVAEPGKPILGLIGSGFLRNYQMLMNFASRKIWLNKHSTTITEVEGLTPTLKLPFSLVGGFPVAEATVNGRAYRFVMDTGATDNILDSSLEDSIRTIWREKAAVTMQDAGAAGQTVRRGNLQRLTVGGLQMDGIEMSISKLPRFDIENNIYGILGFQFFKYFFVDFNYIEGSITCFDMKEVMPRMK
ncbi:Aspartyl protease [Sphingobacterium psychroaquaticum]|uniref:Aspartyl protease n=2 Tax=Sphingobacterium psychroaquaticum TaxID=561061 RepID=A0A1X7IPU7_9SPHI|nr:Aspartyl protease [Sphingobacterium psychroaquaticum]